MINKYVLSLRRIFRAVLIFVICISGIHFDATRMNHQQLKADGVGEEQFMDEVTGMASLQVEELLKQMTIEEKIGQTMVIGFTGRELNPELIEMIDTYHIGGVILVSRNISDPAGVAQLTNALQETALSSGHHGLLVAIDEEGGRVSRLKEYRGFTEFPGAMAISAADDINKAFQVGRSKAVELKSLGINTNLAPVLDVNNNPMNPIIGIRSFSSDSQRVAAYGIAMMLGMQSEGILAVGKHFPGHGDTAVDSHLFLPVVPYDLERLQQVEFVPFQAAMQAGIAGIMSAHIRFPAIDATPGLAATLSPAVMTGLMRRQMGYDGLLVTDSLEMGALAMSGYPAPLAAATALQAGADVLLFDDDPSDQIAAFELIASWVKSGKIPESRLDEAVRRILRTKMEFGLLEPQPVDPVGYEDAIDVEANRALSRSIAYDSITLLRDEESLLPLDREQNILVITIPGARRLGALLDADEMNVSNLPTREEIDYIYRISQEGYDVVVLTTANIQTYPGQALLANRLLQSGVPLVIAAMSSPYDLLHFPDAGTYLASYGANPPSKTALAAVLSGEYEPGGCLPVEIPGLYPLGSGLHGFVSPSAVVSDTSTGD